MNKHFHQYLFLLITLLFLSQEAFPQNVLFNKIYPKPNGIDLEAVAAYQLTSGNYFVIARGGGGSYFARTDQSGNKIWENFNSDGLSPVYSLKRKNSNFLIAGVNFINPNQPKIFVREIDSTGNNIWTNQTSFEHSSYSYGGGIKLLELEDRSIALLASGPVPVYEDFSSAPYFSNFIKLDSGGSFTDSTSLFNSYFGICQAIDSGYILVGGERDTSIGVDFIITKLSSNGDSVWSKVYDSTRHSSIFSSQDMYFGVSIVPLDTSYLVAANTGRIIEGLTSPGFIDHFDMYGNPAPNFGTFNFPDQQNQTLSYILKTQDRGIIIGNSTYTCDDPNDCFESWSFSTISKYDNNYNLSWSDEGSVSWFGTRSVKETNYGFIAIGNTSYTPYPIIPPDYGRLNLWNYDSLGNSISFLENAFVENNKIIAYPNPATDRLNFESSLLINSSVEIHSLQGNVILTSELNGNNPSIDISSLEPGIYFYKIRSEEFNSVGKFIKE